MSDEARQLWQKVFDLRAQRRSRSRRGPKLPFPSEPEMEQLARLLSLDESKIHHFSGSINGIIWDAHAFHAFYGQRHKPTDVVEHVSDVLKAARNHYGRYMALMQPHSPLVISSITGWYLLFRKENGFLLPTISGY
jgi:hypothetical protein